MTVARGIILQEVISRKYEITVLKCLCHGWGIFFFFLTLKMTAAKAVETSVTSTNSLSQDYTNLDDQLPQTCHDSPRFKPFTLIDRSLLQIF